MEREAKEKEEAEGAARDQFPPPPPPMTQQNFIQYMQLVEERQRVTLEQQNKFFQELLQQNRVERPENPGVTLADFQNTKPISFAYAPEPMDAEDWLMDTERKLNTVGCNDQEKVRYATHLLCGPAASWWDNIVAVYPAGKVFTWEEFARKFRESNVPESIVELKRREFESLEQKDKAILTYVREFSKLSRYAVEEVNTEDKKKKRFLRGLSPQFKVQLRMMRATEFQELVDAAITLEDDFKQLQEEKRKKAKFEPKRDRLKIAQSRQKSYADQKRRTWEPQVGDMVYLKTPDEPIAHDELEIQPDLTYIEKPAKILEEAGNNSEIKLSSTARYNGSIIPRGKPPGKKRKT
ncbi:hypothetical protein QYE76_063653 [Lolium multiflorum]|uniref:Retrotransposon gag domain-containing protein n=1 Tax=Lolium multiflorum TaxID=4521 RepID=A0AAD8S639_LOLMU|nr:hypothetical protein QYE76_063653 [Lolium multiflorum]